MFLAAAQVLAGSVTDAELQQGSIYPKLTRVRQVSQAIAVEVCRIALEQNLTVAELPEDLSGFVQSLMYEPNY